MTSVLTGFGVIRYHSLINNLADFAKLRPFEVTGSVFFLETQFPKKFRGKIIDVVEFNQHHWLEESGLKMLIEPI